MASECQMSFFFKKAIDMGLAFIFQGQAQSNTQSWTHSSKSICQVTALHSRKCCPPPWCQCLQQITLFLSVYPEISWFASREHGAALQSYHCYILWSDHLAVWLLVNLSLVQTNIDCWQTWQMMGCFTHIAVCSYLALIYHCRTHLDKHHRTSQQRGPTCMFDQPII